ncbi:hypothetical protein B0H14DRAFT_3137509 [Mycena olivaceomarginata]|nr:hypothetical protein B0H14DRAFT_3137509 [Mycena olivaceomarginata]
MFEQKTEPPRSRIPGVLVEKQAKRSLGVIKLAFSPSEPQSIRAQLWINLSLSVEIWSQEFPMYSDVYLHPLDSESTQLRSVTCDLDMVPRGALEIEESQPGQSFTSYVPGIQRLHNLFVHHKLLKCMEEKVQHKDLEIWERVRFVCAVEHLEKIVFEPPRGIPQLKVCQPSNGAYGVDGESGEQGSRHYNSWDGLDGELDQRWRPTHYVEDLLVKEWQSNLTVRNGAAPLKARSGEVGEERDMTPDRTVNHRGLTKEGSRVQRAPQLGGAEGNRSLSRSVHISGRRSGTTLEWGFCVSSDGPGRHRMKISDVISGGKRQDWIDNAGELEANGVLLLP